MNKTLPKCSKVKLVPSGSSKTGDNKTTLVCQVLHTAYKSHNQNATEMVKYMDIKHLQPYSGSIFNEHALSSLTTDLII